VNGLLAPKRRRALERSGLETASATHRGILAAIEARNPALAAQRMADHIDRTLETGRGRT